MQNGQLFLALFVAILMQFKCNQVQATDPIPKHQTFEIESAAVSETRVINVFLPAEYEDDKAKRFPVLYMPDGGIKEDFPHIANTVADQIKDGKIPPMLVVGIENTDRHRDMTSPSEIEYDNAHIPSNGGSSAFRAFIRDELIPEVNKRYRCCGKSGIIGESLAGLFIMEAFLVEPSLVDIYIAISPSLWWCDHKLTKDSAELISNCRGQHNTLYLSSANERDIYKHTDKLGEILAAHAPEDLTWIYKPRRDLRHHTIFREVKTAAITETFGRGFRFHSKGRF